MKRLFLCSALLLTATFAFAQKAPASPKETETAKIGGTTITIVYSSPRVRGREGQIFTKDGLISHDKDYPYWRAGANSATALTTDGDIQLGDLHVPAGNYTLFVDISDPAQWTLVVSKDTGEWGLNYDKTKDLGRVKMRMTEPPALVEELKYSITARGADRGTLALAWEKQSASVPIRAH
jgi:Protein of unknown function (DUF2911)